MLIEFKISVEYAVLRYQIVSFFFGIPDQKYKSCENKKTYDSIDFPDRILIKRYT
jgi:hypothetical protein